MHQLSRKLSLLRGMVCGHRAYCGPAFVEVDLTNRCNLSCPGCPYHGPQATPPGRDDLRTLMFEPRMFERLCEELHALGTPDLVLQGAGEPLMHPEVASMIRVARTRGLAVRLTTNGTLLRQRMVEQLVDADVNLIRVSLWASSRDQYARNYPGVQPANYDRVLDGIRRVLRHRDSLRRPVPRLVLHHVINRRNHEDIDRVVRLASELGCDGLSFAPLRNTRGALDDLVLDPTQQRSTVASLRRAQLRLQRLGLEHNVPATCSRYGTAELAGRSIPCTSAWFYCRVRVDGEVVSCSRRAEDGRLGSLGEQSFTEIWNGDPALRLRAQAWDPRSPRPPDRGADCHMCPFVNNLLRVHHYARWLAPLLRWHARVRPPT